MKAIVDRDACTGCGLCVSTCPDVFEQDVEGIAVVKANPVPSAQRDNCREAAEACPVNAITLVE